MKKEKQKPKEKEFSATPFKALKGASLDLRATPAAPAPAQKKEEKPGKTVRELSDEMLFFEAVAGVKRLSGSTPAKEVKAVQAAKVQREEEDQAAFLKALEALRLDVRFSDQLAEEPVPRPAPVNRLRQVRRGGIRIDLQLDLHGLTKDEALENLDRFVKGAYNRGQKGVLVITGKGNNSAGEPVLKVAVANWLRESGKGMVAEFVQAPNDMGGSGAFVVFLKEKKVEPEA